MHNDELYDELRRFQRIPRQKPAPAKEKAEKIFEQSQSKCMRIPKSVVREARDMNEEDTRSPLQVVQQFVSSLLK